MARKVILEIEANAGTATGALEEVQQRIDQVKRSFTEGEEAAEKSFNQIGRSSENAISSIRGLERATQQVFSELVESTGQGVRAVDSMEASFNDLRKRAQAAEVSLQDYAQGAERASLSLKDVARVQGRVASTGTTMRSSVGASANNLGFELVQASQDAKFGMAGVANQIPLMSEQFTQLTQKTGSTTAALQKLGSTFLGPVGIIGGITLLLTFQEEIVSFFSSMGGAAEEAEEQFQGLLNTTRNLATELPNLEDAATAIEERLGEISVQSGDVLRQFGRLAGSDAIQFITRGAREGDVSEPIRQEQVRLLGEFRDVLSQNTTQAALMQAALREAGADIDTLLTGNFQAAQTEIAVAGQALEDLGNNAQEALQQPGVLAGEIANSFQRLEEQLRLRLEAGLITPVDAANRRVEFLEQSLQQARDAFSADELSAEDFDQIFGPLSEDLRKARVEVKRLGEETEEPIDLSFILEPIPELQEALRRGGGPAEVAGPEVVPPEDLGTFALSSQLETIGDLQQANLISPLQAAQQEVQAIQQEILAAIHGGWEPQSDKVQGLQTRLQSTQQDLRQMTNITERFGAVTQQVLVRGFLRVGDAIGQGVTQAIFEAESAAQALQNAFQSVIQSIIQQLISLATQLLVIEALSSFIPGFGQASAVSSFSGGIMNIGGTPAGEAFGLQTVATSETATFSGMEMPSVRSFGSSSSTGSTSFSIGKAGTESARVAGGMLDISVPLGLLDEGVGQGQEMRRRTGKGGANLEGGSLSV